MTRSIYISTNCGCSMPGITKALERERFEKLAEGQLAKGRKRPVKTAVGRYVSRKAPALAQDIHNVFRAHLRKVKPKILAAYAKHIAKLQKFDDSEPRDDHGRWTGQTETPEFKAWFGDSKMVDSAGKPLVVYRGGVGDKELPPGFLNAQARDGYAVFASESPHVASSFGNPEFDFSPRMTGAITPLYVKADRLIEFPVTPSRHGGGNEFDKFAFDRAARALPPATVLVARKVFDYGPRASVAVDPARRYSYAADQYAWSNGTSVKSATGNSGAFDPRNPDITKLAKIDDTDIEDIVGFLAAGDMADQTVETIRSAVVQAFSDAGRYGLDQVGISATTDEGQTMDEMTHQVDAEAVFWAANRGGQLIKDLANTTDEDLRGLLSTAVDTGMSVDDLATALDDLGAFGEVRSAMIASTELAFAHVQGNVEGWRASGEVEQKRWILGDLHDVEDICDDCVDAGDVDLEDDFGDTGLDFPPAHPNCWCDVIPILKSAPELGDDSDTTDSGD